MALPIRMLGISNSTDSDAIEAIAKGKLFSSLLDLEYVVCPAINAITMSTKKLQ
jgi:hypothetical protein